MIIKKKLGPKGQILIPKSVREHLGIRPGSEINIEIRDNEIGISAAKDNDRFLQEFLKVPKKLTKPIDLKEIILERY